MEEIAEVYARALFEAAKENGVLDRVHDELGPVRRRARRGPQPAGLPVSPYFSSERRSRAFASS
jgi:F0F1-type ATP synthase delta subunit